MIQFLGCGNGPSTITSSGENIEIISPHYPKSQLTILDCSHIIKFPIEKALRLDFIEFEFRKNHYKIEVYDGNNTDARLIYQNKICRETIPQSIFSSGNEVLFQMTDNYGSTHPAFNSRSKVSYKIHVEAKGNLEVQFQKPKNHFKHKGEYEAN